MSSSRRLPVEAAAQLGQQVDGLASGEARPQLHVPGDVGEPPVQLDRVLPRVLAEELGPAGVGAQQPQQDADRRGLSRPVGPEETVHLTCFDGEVETREGVRPTERLVQSGDGDCLLHIPKVRFFQKCVKLRNRMNRSID